MEFSVSREQLLEKVQTGGIRGRAQANNGDFGQRFD